MNPESKKPVLYRAKTDKDIFFANSDEYIKKAVMESKDHPVFTKAGEKTCAAQSNDDCGELPTLLIRRLRALESTIKCLRMELQEKTQHTLRLQDELDALSRICNPQRIIEADALVASARRRQLRAEQRCQSLKRESEGLRAEVARLNGSAGGVNLTKKKGDIKFSAEVDKNKNKDDTSDGDFINNTFDELGSEIESSLSTDNTDAHFVHPVSPPAQDRINVNIANSYHKILEKSAHRETQTLPFDLELFKRNCAILSAHAGDKQIVEADICSKGSLRQLRQLRDRHEVKIEIFANGLVVNKGPLRPYGWALCSSVVDDILEGYYPYEFKECYPDGFPIVVIDKSGETFESQKELGSSSIPTKSRFVGEGIRLGGELAPKNRRDRRPWIVPNYVKDSESKSTYTENTPLKGQNFLKKLPTQYISEKGEVVNVRDKIQCIIGNPSGGKRDSTTTIIAETALPGEQKNGKYLDSVIALKVRLPSGQRVVLAMREGNTVNDVYKELERAVPCFIKSLPHGGDYDFVFSFPRRICHDRQVKLGALNLPHMCALMVKVRNSK